MHPRLRTGSGRRPCIDRYGSAVHPGTREIYVTLSYNDQRGDKVPLDKANPRSNNLHGQILRWNEVGADPFPMRDHRHHLEPGLPCHVDQCAASRAELSASDGKSRPRFSTMLITRNDGGVIGTSALSP